MLCLIQRLIQKLKICNKKKEEIQVRYWFRDNRIFKEYDDKRIEVELIYSYFSFFMKTKYVLWLEYSEKAGTRELHMGILEETGRSIARKPVIPIVDDYQMMNAIIELKKKVGIIN